MDVETLERIFPQVWSRETSAFPDEWSEDNPSCGQCFHTSWVAFTYLRGTVLQSVLPHEGFVHFWNVLPGGTVHDFTAAQLCGTEIDQCKLVRTVITPRVFRQYLEYFTEARKRYQLFCERFLEMASSLQEP